MATVYLIHFDSPLKHARHYIGYTALESVYNRLARHKAGDGAKILRVCNERGITYRIVKTWEFGTWQEARDFERKLKRRKMSPRICPVCNGHLCNQENFEIENSVQSAI